jgi:hypothetical protein|tara:strand:+ start:7753 stop:7890 length:138 start_codon:yes stop_codon:yes gene_type:complete
LERRGYFENTFWQFFDETIICGSCLIVKTGAASKRQYRNPETTHT